MKLNKIKSALLENMHWKLGSLVISIILWFVILNIDNPVKTVTVPIPLVVNNESALLENGKILMNSETLKNQVIYVTVRGTSKELDNLGDKLIAYVDLSLFEIVSGEQAGSYRTEVIVTKRSNEQYDIIDKKPSIVDVELEQFVTAEKEVTPNFSGVAAQGFTHVVESVTPEKVKVSGAKSAVSTIKSVVVDVNIEGASANLSVSGKPKAIMADGSESTDVQISEEAAVKIAIYKLGKVYVNKPKYTGKPAEGYVVVDTIWSPMSAEVMGEESSINSLKPIDLEPSKDVNGATKTVTNKYDLRFYMLGQPISILNGEEHMVTVEFIIEKEITKTLFIPVSSLQVTGSNPRVRLVTETAEIKVKGVESVINSLESLKGFINVTGIADGKSTVPIEFAIPRGVTIVGGTPTAEVELGPEVSPVTAPPTE